MYYVSAQFLNPKKTSDTVSFLNEILRIYSMFISGKYTYVSSLLNHLRTQMNTLSDLILSLGNLKKNHWFRSWTLNEKLLLILEVIILICVSSILLLCVPMLLLWYLLPVQPGKCQISHFHASETPCWWMAHCGRGNMWDYKSWSRGVECCRRSERGLASVDLWAGPWILTLTPMYVPLAVPIAGAIFKGHSFETVMWYWVLRPSGWYTKLKPLKDSI